MHQTKAEIKPSARPTDSPLPVVQKKSKQMKTTITKHLFVCHTCRATKADRAMQKPGECGICRMLWGQPYKYRGSINLLALMPKR